MNKQIFLINFFLLLSLACKSGIDKDEKINYSAKEKDYDSLSLKDNLSKKEILYPEIVKYKVKQLEHFFDRFNYKENPDGNKFDKLVNPITRKKCLTQLFDKNYFFIADSLLLNQFIENVCKEEFYLTKSKLRLIN